MKFPHRHRHCRMTLRQHLFAPMVFWSPGVATALLCARSPRLACTGNKTCLQVQSKTFVKPQRQIILGLS